MKGTVTHVAGDGTKTEFELETLKPGEVPERVIDELCSARRIAKDYATGYNDAAKAQAEKFKVKPGALKRYIAAKVDDTLEDVRKETDDLERLLA